MYKALAGPGRSSSVGKSIRLFVIDVDYEREKLHVLMVAKIIISLNFSLWSSLIRSSKKKMANKFMKKAA